MNKSLVSIIIPCYNQGSFIDDAINSLVRQSHQHWECLIVNDGSTDTSEECALRWSERDARIKYFYQDNLGVSAARNYGLKRAKGEFIQFLDADDLLESHKLQVGLEIFSINTKVGIVVSGAKYFLNESQEIFQNNLFDDKPWMEELWAQKTPLIKKLLQRNLMPINAPLTRMSVIKAVGYFDEKMSACEDWEYWLRCAIHKVKFKYHKSNHTDSLIRVHLVSASQNRLAMYRGESELSIKVAQSLIDPQDVNLNYKLGLARIKKARINLKLYDILRLFIASRKKRTK